MTQPRRLVPATIAALALLATSLPVAGAQEADDGAEVVETPVGDALVDDALVDDAFAGEAFVGEATISEMTSRPGTSAGDRWRRVIRQSKHRDKVEEINAYSPSMGREIPLAVIPAVDENEQPLKNAPTLYLLNGAGGAEQGVDWISQAPGLIDFYRERGVNIVIPQSGAFSYYVDWYSEPTNGLYNLQGPQMWETFLTKELPGPIESYLDANDRRGIVGFSMSATSSLLLAEHNPGFYDSVGSFSGCAATSSPLPYWFHSLTVDRAGVDAEQLFGEQGSEYNVYNDALVNAEGLRGSEIYVSTASGLAGQTDFAGYLRNQGVGSNAAVEASSRLVIEGGIIEAATNGCTHDLSAKLDSLDIDAEFNFRNAGTHSWAYWRDDIEDSWPTLARGLGLADDTASLDSTPGSIPSGSAPEKPTGPDAGEAPVEAPGATEDSLAVAVLEEAVDGAEIVDESVTGDPSMAETSS